MSFGLKGLDIDICYNVVGYEMLFFDSQITFYIWIRKSKWHICCQVVNDVPPQTGDVKEKGESIRAQTSHAQKVVSVGPHSVGLEMITFPLSSGYWKSPCTVWTLKATCPSPQCLDSLWKPPSLLAAPPLMACTLWRPPCTTGTQKSTACSCHQLLISHSRE